MALSRRLQTALATLHRDRFAPGPEALVLEGVAPRNFRNREWRRILKRVGIGHRRLKDLRDTYASQLLTAGVQLGYVSLQLGHSDVAVTARHYARWCGDDVYRDPIALAEGEVPADLLSRLAGERPQGDPIDFGPETGRPRKPSNPMTKAGTPGGIRTHDPQVRSRIEA